jgi:hypothetical protein
MKVLVWLKKLFVKEETFDSFLKELVKYVKGTRDTGPH